MIFRDYTILNTEMKLRSLYEAYWKLKNKYNFVEINEISENTAE